MSQGHQSHHKEIQEQLTWAHRSSQIPDPQPGGLHGTDLGLLHMCDSCVVGSICGTPNNGSRMSLVLWLALETLLLMLNCLNTGQGA